MPIRIETLTTLLIDIHNSGYKCTDMLKSATDGREVVHVTIESTVQAEVLCSSIVKMLRLVTFHPHSYLAQGDVQQINRWKTGSIAHEAVGWEKNRLAA